MPLYARVWRGSICQRAAPFAYGPMALHLETSVARCIWMLPLRPRRGKGR